MSNWATRIQQKSVLPKALDPVSELFRCPSYGGCVLSRTQCVNRYVMANGDGRWKLTKYIPCRGCKIGLAHKRGERTPRAYRLTAAAIKALREKGLISAAAMPPRRQWSERRHPGGASRPPDADRRPMEEAQSESQQKIWKPRKCLRGKHMFTPKPGPDGMLQRNCEEQGCVANPTAAKSGARSAPAATRPAAPGKPTNADELATFLRALGYHVSAVNAPRGVVLLVESAA